LKEKKNLKCDCFFFFHANVLDILFPLKNRKKFLEFCKFVLEFFLINFKKKNEKKFLSNNRRKFSKFLGRWEKIQIEKKFFFWFFLMEIIYLKHLQEKKKKSHSAIHLNKVQNFRSMEPPWKNRKKNFFFSLKICPTIN